MPHAPGGRGGAQKRARRPRSLGPVEDLQGVVDLGLEVGVGLQQHEELAVVHLQHHACYLPGELRLKPRDRRVEPLADHLLLHGGRRRREGGGGQPAAASRLGGSWLRRGGALHARLHARHHPWAHARHHARHHAAHSRGAHARHALAAHHHVRHARAHHAHHLLPHHGLAARHPRANAHAAHHAAHAAHVVVVSAATAAAALEELKPRLLLLFLQLQHHHVLALLPRQLHAIDLVAQSRERQCFLLRGAADRGDGERAILLPRLGGQGLVGHVIQTLHLHVDAHRFLPVRPGVLRDGLARDVCVRGPVLRVRAPVVLASHHALELRLLRLLRSRGGGGLLLRHGV
mmetsp:Transcript_102891/g.291460  ORF Transcript_102891/g.291460 Transcript_102891/m.291460 type:complete len:346 (+) Transcript_102891:176-1213(+)